MALIAAAARPHRDDAYGRVAAIHAVSRDNRFEALVQRHERRLRRLIFGMIGDASRVEDVLQETLLRAYRGLPKAFAHENVEAAWIYRIAHRCALNELRARRRRPETPGLPDTLFFESNEEAVAAHEIVAALATLDVRSRAAVLLVDLVGLAYESAARALRMPRGTLAWRLSAARDELRKRLDG
jgi:RNA polymerase sigma-70 factor (ECF subfamily)